MAPVTDDGDGRKLLASRASERERTLSAYKGSKSGGGQDAFGADFSRMPLKPDHTARPCWTCPDGNIYLEAFHDLYVQAYDFLVAIAEPVARPEFVHQYKLTAYSLYAAVATNITTESIVSVLERLSKNQLPSSVKTFIRECTKQYGKAKLVLKHNKVYVESENPQVLRDLLRDPTIEQARVVETDTSADADGFLTHSKAEEMKENLHMLEPDEDSDEEDEGGGDQQQQRTVVSFQIKGEQVEQVKRQAIELDYPLSTFLVPLQPFSCRTFRLKLEPHTRLLEKQWRNMTFETTTSIPTCTNLISSLTRGFVDTRNVPSPKCLEMDGHAVVSSFCRVRNCFALGR
jgi:DNA excision repair protein ERCC-3